MDTLQSLLPVKELNPLFWDNGKLEQQISHQLILIAEDFIDSCDLKTLGVFEELVVVDYYFTGSLCNYNWSEQSDVDLHIMIDFSNIEESYREVVKAYLQAQRNDYNTKFAIKILGFDVELSTVEVNQPIPKDSGVYSLLYDKWITNPSREDVEIDQEYIWGKVNTFKNYIDWVLSEERDPLLTEKITEYILNRIKKLRKSALDKGGEFSDGNLIFKVLRREGYIEKLRNLQIDITNQELSMEGVSQNNLIKLGTCVDENLVEDIFGSVSEFARQTEEEGDNFTYGSVKITYNPKTDIHTFWQLPKKAIVLKDSFYFKKGELVEGKVSDKGILQIKEHALNEGNYILLEKLSTQDQDEVKKLVKQFMKLFLWRLWTRQGFLTK